MDGVLSINKLKGITSHDVVQKVRRILAIKRVGHTGTLDKYATGVLIVLIGKATKISQFLKSDTKEYEASLKLGITTSTQDAWGEVLGEEDCSKIEVEDVKRVLDKFKGELEQTPPIFSAIHVGGRRSYELARCGEKVEHHPRKVIIYEIEMTNFKKKRFPELSIRVVVSPGTYIRKLCEDIGQALGVGAHLTSLNRTRNGPFKILSSITLQELEEAKRCDKLMEVICTMDKALSNFPAVEIMDRDIGAIINGQAVYSNRIDLKEGLAKIRSPYSQLLGIGKVYKDGKKTVIKPFRIFYQEA
ncbi:MAG: tRNA pseudouridine(55) synthase TruB [bacterium]|nr:tRNA pseudouridine(55) synthase TruB [bacterium]